MSDDTAPRSAKQLANIEPSYTPDPIEEISFVENLTDEICIIVTGIVRTSPAQAKRIEEAVKRFLNKAL